jgi:hypothetical protein
MSLFVKDPNDVLDYRWDWSSWLASGETIQTSTVTVPTGITKDSDTNTTTTVTVWLSSGTAGQTYRVVSRITTSQGRTVDRSMFIKVDER